MLKMLGKRKADDAFAQRTVAKSDHGNKIVNFHDDEEPKTGAPPTTNEPKMGRLKARAQALAMGRQALPIHPHADEIRFKLVDHDVLLLVGETGSGKSTQVPQFLLDQKYSQRSSKVGSRIAITQPRRVAAISLARRVAEEMGTPLGGSSPASQVGYSVRFDTSTGPNTRIKFLTDGMLLQELIRDPWLKEYSVVVVDEVHERGVNVDLILGFLKRIVEGRKKKDGRGGVPLKVIVMSATADMDKIEKFFGTGTEVNGSTNGTKSATVNGKEEFEGFSEDETLKSTTVDTSKPTSGTTSHPIRTTSCFIKGRQFPVTINYTPQPVASSWDAALDRIIQIHQHTPLPGDVLVFLPGQEAIDSLESMCISYANTLAQQSKQKGAPKVPKLLILPLFAALPTNVQQRVFEQTPPFTRKIILSTNIAETSVTVPGIRHVIDTGKRKARFFRPSLNLDTLLTTSISRSSAKQRAGRAGREAPGSCWRLYTEKTFYELEADTEPEILRCDLSQLVLTLKAHGVDDILSFPLLTRPPVKALERALLLLLQLKAIDPQTGNITDLGRRMSRLPLPANLARILLASTEPQYNCAAEMIDIVSGLSVENIWLPIHQQSRKSHTNADSTENTTINNDDDDEEEDENPIQRARSTLHRRQGDHLTLLAAIQSFTAEHTDRKSWCRRHAISHRAITAALEVRKQLSTLIPIPNRTSTNAEQPIEDRILRALLTGLFPNTARLHLRGDATGKAEYRTYFTSKPVQVHPSSVLFRARARAGGEGGAERRPVDVVFSELVYTAKPYARVVSEVRPEWIQECMDDDGHVNGGEDAG